MEIAREIAEREAKRADPFGMVIMVFGNAAGAGGMDCPRSLAKSGSMPSRVHSSCASLRTSVSESIAKTGQPIGRIGQRKRITDGRNRAADACPGSGRGRSSGRRAARQGPPSRPSARRWPEDRGDSVRRRCSARPPPAHDALAPDGHRPRSGCRTRRGRFIFAVRAPNGRKPLNHRLVPDGVFSIARSGSPWRDPSESSASGPGSVAGSGAGPWPGFGSISWTP